MSCPDHANACCARWCFNCREDEKEAVRATEADAIVRELAELHPDGNPQELIGRARRYVEGKL